MRKRDRSALFATIFAGVFVAGSLLFAGTASAQESNCPAGGRGGEGGDAGRSIAGSGGLAFVVGGFGTTGNASAPGGVPGSARGGDGARGGAGTLPICNQNTNGGGAGGGAEPAAPAPAAAAPVAAAPVAAQQQQQQGQGGGVGGGLARTGARTSLELSLAGLALALGGAFLFFGQPAKQAILRLVGAAPSTAASAERQDWNVLGWSPPFRKDS